MGLKSICFNPHMCCMYVQRFAMLFLQQEFSHLVEEAQTKSYRKTIRSFPFTSLGFCLCLKIKLCYSFQVTVELKKAWGWWFLCSLCKYEEYKTLPTPHCHLGLVLQQFHSANHRPAKSHSFWLQIHSAGSCLTSPHCRAGTSLQHRIATPLWLQDPLILDGANWPANHQVLDLGFQIRGDSSTKTVSL